MAEKPVTPGEELYTRAEVAALFRVNASTLDRWAKSGRLDGAVVRTLGGRRRFRATAIRALLNGQRS